MKYILFCLLFIVFHELTAQEKLSFSIPSSGSGIEMKSQMEIDQMAKPSEGFIVLNSDTKCINYFIGGTWFELCGTCLPKPEIPNVINIQYALKAWIIETNKTTDDLIAICNNDTIVSNNGKIIIIEKGTEKINSIYLVSKNQCGFSLAKKVDLNNNFSYQIYTDKIIDEKTKSSYNYIKIENLFWLTEDIKKSIDSKNTIVQSGFLYQNYLAAQNACPEGWRLPTKLEVEKLSNYFIPVDSIFSKQLSATQLQISYSGIIDPLNKQLFGNLTNHYFWTSTSSANNKNYFLNIGKSGFIVMDADKSSLMSVRCVKDANNK